MSKVKFRNRYDGIKTQGFFSVNPSLTEQSFAYEVDINNIVAGRTCCSIPETRKPMFVGDLPPVKDLQTALQTIADCKNHFVTLPADLREKFDNSPEKMLNFVTNPDNYDKSVELGLIVPKSDNAVKVEVVNVSPVVTGDDVKTSSSTSEI